ncbi:hypothetical protein [Paradesulfitobacterium ferrireducens]|uniref:hypothetical protein n=1 Tax=Paradesulfitobacterium ferrireducens TaxID=2816476 RepID=UPI001A8CEF4A|nr:hypothetical protein [Paradesulfitobacterium ferrireducens]
MREGIQHIDNNFGQPVRAGLTEKDSQAYTEPVFAIKSSGLSTSKSCAKPAGTGNTDENDLTFRSYTGLNKHFTYHPGWYATGGEIEIEAMWRFFVYNPEDIHHNRFSEV